jgi:hypothetical protein
MATTKPDDDTGIPDYYQEAGGTKMSGAEHRALLDRQADEKLVKKAEEAKKFSSKAAALGMDLLSIGKVFTPADSPLRTPSAFSKLQETERLGGEAKKRLDSGKKKGGVIKMAKGGSASGRADGCATKGKTKGRFV